MGRRPLRGRRLLLVGLGLLATNTTTTWLALAAPPHQHDARAAAAATNKTTCRQAEVVILGAGVAGITAAQALANHSVADFVILERNDYVGGRMAHTTFGDRGDGTGAPYVVELGANWVQGLGAAAQPGAENPVWALAKKWGVANVASDYDALATYDARGASDYADVLAAYDAAAAAAFAEAGAYLTENWQDPAARVGLAMAGWRPSSDDDKDRQMKMTAVEWWNWDWDAAAAPDASSFVFGVTGDNFTFGQFGDQDNFVTDPRGFNAWLRGEASTFLALDPDNGGDINDDTRLLLNTTVTRIEYSPDGAGVTVTFTGPDDDDYDCIEAQYAICTFSLGVLQHEGLGGDDEAAAAALFAPPLPRWKREAIATFQMGTYTKIFYQFNTTFWPTDDGTQFLLYADPTTRGYYPVWQSLDAEGFFPGSHILFATVVDDEARRVERQSDEATKQEGLAVLRRMFPDVDVPEPTAFMYPRWTDEPWARGSYSNWPVGMTLEKHQNLRANVGALWFAGEHTSAEYYGFLHGSWYEGSEAGARLAAMLKGNGTSHVSYDVLHGTTPLSEWTADNGITVTDYLEAAGIS